MKDKDGARWRSAGAALPIAVAARAVPDFRRRYRCGRSTSLVSLLDLHAALA